jgi:hypothetical protein
VIIRTISNLAISEVWDDTTTLHKISLRQGDLDGACGPYALMMALLLADSGLKRSDAIKLWEEEEDGPTKLATWTKKFTALISLGTNEDDLNDLFLEIQTFVGTKKINNLCLEQISISENSLKGVRSLLSIRDHIDTYDKPILIGINWSKNQGHWVVAVGYQLAKGKSGEQVANILTVDPSQNASKISPWNGVLGLGHHNDKKLRYLTEEYNDKCDVEESQCFGFKVRH